jgi:Fe2+ or Zn2+ uptake regulation protein
MFRLFQFLIDGCFHEYEVIEKSEYEQTTVYNTGRHRESHITVHILRCKKCGKIIDHIVTV